MIQDDEILNIVDENDYVIGQKKRSEIYCQRLCNFRVVNAFVVNSLGQLWIPRRSAHKSIFPFCLDVSMGGQPLRGIQNSKFKIEDPTDKSGGLN